MRAKNYFLSRFLGRKIFTRWFENLRCIRSCNTFKVIFLEKYLSIFLKPAMFFPRFSSLHKWFSLSRFSLLDVILSVQDVQNEQKKFCVKIVSFQVCSLLVRSEIFSSQLKWLNEKRLSQIMMKNYE